MTDYEYYKKLGICVHCRQDNIYKKLSTILCLSCLHKQREKYINEPYQVRKNRQKRQRNASKIKYYKRKLEELCPRCRRKSDNEFVYCYYCRKKQTLKYNHKRYDNEILNICNLCGKNKRIEGKRVCNKCYILCLEKVNKMNNLRSDGYFNNK